MPDASSPGPESQQPQQGRGPVSAGSPPPPPPPPPGYPPVSYAPPPPRSRGALGKVVTSLVGTVLILSLVTNVYLGMILASLTGGPSEAEYAPGDPAYRVVVLPIVGMIDDDAAVFVRRALRALRDDPPTAIVLRVDSGGGGIAPSDRIWHELERFQADHPDVPVVASFGGIAASGGYYVAAATGHIVAEPTCITGSIGVIATAFTAEGLVEKIGITPEVLTATTSPEKDVANNPLRAWTDKDRRVLRRILDAAHQRFITVVEQGRAAALTPEELAPLLDGRIFTADEALDAKLIDQVGYLPDAVAKAAELAGVPAGVEPRVTVISQPSGLGLLRLLGLRGGSSARTLLEVPAFSAERVRGLAEELTTPRAAYRAPFKLD